jgi:hypothetical protein
MSEHPTPADDPRRSGAVGRLGALRAAGAALDLVRARWRPLGTLWLALIALNVAGTLVGREMNVSGSRGMDFALMVLESVPVAFLTLGMARILLDAPNPWRADARGLAFAGFDLASSTTLWGWFALGALATGEGLVESFTARAVWFTAGLAIWCVSALSSLWIFAQAARDPRMTLPESWRRMRGALFGLLGASTLLAILPDQASTIMLDLLPLGVAPPGGTVELIVGAVSSAIFSVMITAVPAAIYRLRGGPDGDLAQVFD